MSTTITFPAHRTHIVNFASDSSLKQSFEIKYKDDVLVSGSCQGTGPQVIDSQTFETVDSLPYTVNLYNERGASEVIHSEQATIDPEGKEMSKTWVFLAEDASDADYNDAVLSIVMIDTNK